MLTQEKAIRALRAAGVRLTPQRMMIVDALLDNKSHPTVEQLFTLVRARFEGISLATVYHTLSLFARSGLVVELHGSKDGKRFDPNTAEHSHAYCTECNSVFDLPQPPMTLWNEDDISGFQAGSIEISLFGICADCTRLSKLTVAQYQQSQVQSSNSS